MRGLLADAFAALPGEVGLAALSISQEVRGDGEIVDVEHAPAVRLVVRPNAPIKIALTGHYDTVFPASHGVSAAMARGRDVARTRRRGHEGRALTHARGAGGVRAIAGEKRVGYEVLMSPDEEIGSPGSAPLLAELGQARPVGLTYEPAMADGALVDARKGSGNYSLTFRGRSAHVGRAFADGRNAVMAAAEAALALNALNGKQDGVTVNVGAIDGGGPVNVVPDRAVLRFNVRAPDLSAAAYAQSEISRIAATAGKRDGVSADLHGGITRPPKPITATQATMIGWTRSAGTALGLDLGFRPSGGVCEGNNLAAAGCPNVDTLGPCGGNIHSDQEFALIASFTERAKLSFLLLAGIERGVFDIASLRS